MLDAGILHEDDRVELIAGEIVAMSPINAPHAGHVKRLIRLFTSRLGDRALISAQDPVQLGEDSQPQPDVALLKPRDDFYARSHPTPADVLLIVEVSDSTVDYDRDVKAPLYAPAGVPELWLVNLADGRLEADRLQGPKGYREQRRLWPGDEIAPLAFPEVIFRVDEILG